jgi:hypothetical protein
MADTQRFFSRLVDNLATEVQRQISGRGQTDRQRRHNAFSWYDQRRQHDATSSGHGWTDQRQRHDAPSLGCFMVWLVTCNDSSACVGRLINGGNTMLFLGIIDGGDTTLLLAGVGGLINGRDTTLLLSAG